MAATPTHVTKKRSAPAQRDKGPPSKKIKSGAPAVKRKENVKPKDTKVVKRSQPITKPAEPSSDDENSDEEGWETQSDAENEHTMEVDEVPNEVPESKKTDSARESHAAQKLAHQQRKAAKPNADVLSNAKRLWSAVRQKDTPKEQRRRAVTELMNTVRGRVQDVVFKHDASRIIQSLVKYGGQEERDTVATELKGRYKELAQSKYSKFLVTKLIRYSPTNRSAILAEFHGHVIRLLLHREATRVISDAFELYASASDRCRLTSDFYGKEVALFSNSSEKPAFLGDLLNDADETRRRRVLDAVRQNLLTVFNNPDKGAVTCAVVHRVLLEYLQDVKKLPDEEEDKLRRDMLESCQELLAEMVHTKDGSRAVREFIAQGNAKDRKAIIKTLKPHVEKMCAVDEAQLVLFTALDAIDDTKLLAKSVVTPMTSTLPILKAPTCPAASRRSILYLFTPRSARHFTPPMIATVSDTDAARDKTSKKDVETRRQELRKAASDDMLPLLESADAIKELLLSPGSSLVITDILLHAEGDTSKVIQSMVAFVSEPYIMGGNHPIDLSHVSRVYKTLLQGGHYSQSTKSVILSPQFSAIDFACAFTAAVGQESIISMAKSGGSFVIIELLQTVLQHGEGREECSLLKSWFDAEVCTSIKESDPKGRDLLLQKVELLSRL